MEFVQADGLSLAFFCLFAAVMLALIFIAVARSSHQPKAFFALFGSYLLAFCALVASGLPSRQPLPVIPILFLSVFVMALAISLSRYGERISARFSLAVLIGFQAFRLPLELILHHWADLGTVPATMTWAGQNWDIASGVVSFAAIPFANRSRAVAWLAQLTGFVLLLNVLRVVAMSSPFPFSWPLENPLQLAAHLPYALIGPLFVGPALAGHLITFRKLRAQSAPASSHD